MTKAILLILGLMCTAAQAKEIYCMGSNININLSKRLIFAPEFGIGAAIPASISANPAEPEGALSNVIYTIMANRIFITVQPSESNGWGGPQNAHITIFDAKKRPHTQTALCNIK